ncbi:MAG: hypothetical protein NZ534_13300, partial [Bacteroidia bacterium]|nr:hypothetical protein [Bacteroidia bacterium]
MESGLRIEGGYRVVNGNWTKEPSAVTTVNFVNCLEEVPGGTGFNVGHHIGVKCNFVNDFALQDLVLNIPSVTGTTENRGRSVYGIYLNGSSNYEITRVRVTVGNASAGADGAPGTPGAQGARGQDGGNARNNDCGGSWGNGGAGGNNPTINGAPGGNGGTGQCGGAGGGGVAGTSSGGVSGGAA